MPVGTTKKLLFIPSQAEQFQLHSHERSSSPLNTVFTFSCIQSGTFLSPRCWGALTWTQYFRCASGGLGRKKGSPPSTFWECFACCTPGYWWSFLAWGCISASQSAWWAPEPPGSSCRADFWSDSLLTVLLHGIILHMVKDFAFSFAEFQEVPVSSFL